MKSKNKNKLLNTIERLIYMAAPVIGTVVMCLLPYVGTNVELTISREFLGRSILVSGVLMSYYFCFRAIFNTMFMDSKRIQSKLTEYSINSTLVYDGHLSRFEEYCDYEYDQRVQKFVNRNMQVVDFTFDEFKERYKFSLKLIKADKSLSKRQRNALIKIVITIKFIKRQDYEKVLPGTEAGTIFVRVKSSMNKKSKVKSAAKIGWSICAAVLTMSYAFTIDFTAGAIAVVIQIFLLLFAGIYQIVSALFASKSLISKTYFNELCEKNLFMNEYIQWDNLTDELKVLQDAAQKNNDNKNE